VPEPIERGEQLAGEDRVDAGQHLGLSSLRWTGMSVLLIRCFVRIHR
jgi:hypothetical protein